MQTAIHLQAQVTDKGSIELKNIPIPSGTQVEIFIVENHAANEQLLNDDPLTQFFGRLEMTDVDNHSIDSDLAKGI
ncbi:hypothetical protein [Candidatus Albibeggiatoa sp. nov. BB20]|uniref:hypothetical protein n=1 Tax=Candidatus Albibeggiatoa sp. nov. BB20 TaxID=3162723 RepID=UPI003365A31B